MFSQFHLKLQHERTVQNSDKVRKERVQKGGGKRSKYIRNLIVNYKASGLSTLKIQRKTVCYEFEISLIDIRAISPWSIRNRFWGFFSEKKFKMYLHDEILPLNRFKQIYFHEKTLNSSLFHMIFKVRQQKVVY